jgi:hypothetical protein
MRFTFVLQQLLGALQPPVSPAPDISNLPQVTFYLQNAHQEVRTLSLDPVWLYLRLQFDKN